jgi:hypothetical protein
MLSEIKACRRMPPIPFATLLLAISFATIGGMAYAAAHGFKALSATLAAAFFLSIAVAGFAASKHFRRPDVVASGTPRIARLAMQSAALMSVIVYAWAAAALLVIYQGSGLIWQHGWQYALVLSLIALGLAHYVRDLSRDDHWASQPAAIAGSVRLAMLHGAVSAAIFVWILAAGKLATVKGDWAANHIFLATTASIAILSVIAVQTYRAQQSR